ncbi:DNA mismatch repair protein MutL [Calderihabitans maritimus]|uniref:DNA mismatch repair protein MutL n=1 Tax=Calderihabitans maritimus TaxID=1246530 RepID=A0A1Z5HPQ8_9FIRM|nr:DNA mismatch repair protein MutL [Calderihabitans maritimus]
MDQETADKIAAGEVIERPASVVKELVENSLDAGSRMIEVEIRGWGLDYIRVTDNGEGMTREEIPLAFQRHATSKIRNAQDLDSVLTLGFRGEALPSIAAVAKVEVLTRTEKSLQGHRFEIIGGKELSLEPCGCPKGTTVNVRDLFFNTPVRKKYLKKPATEMALITETVGRLALAHPHVAFRLTHNQRVILTTSGKNNLLETIASVYGPEIGRSLLPVDYQGKYLRVTGYVGRPELHRGNRSYQNFFVNRRYIRHSLLNQALEQAFHTLIPTNRHPLAVIHLQLNPELVDVNVHPAKLEVRFREEREVAVELTKGIRDALGRTPLVRKVKEVVKKPDFQAAHQVSINWENDGSSVARQRAAIAETAETYLERKVDDKLPYLKVLGQVGGTYIVAATDDDLYLIDQHAAHERVMYERLMHKVKKSQIHSQILAVPVTLELSPPQVQVLEKKISTLAALGITVEAFGGNTFLIRTFPLDLKVNSQKEFLLDLIDVVLDADDLEPAELQEKAVTVMACRAAVKANEILSVEEMEFILEELRKTEVPYTCPHGRPTVLHLSKQELARRFGRT